MNELNKLINIYLKVGEKFLTQFFDEEKVKIPKSEIDWICNGLDQGGTLKSGAKYFKHGAGIDFIDDKYQISIDFGTNGEWNGFDSWKLFLFITSSNIKTNIKDKDEIQSLIVKGIEEGIFVKKDLLYFQK